MKKDLFALFVDLVSKFRVSSISKFENLVKENITDDTMILDNFSDIMTKLKRDVIQHFVNSSSGLFILFFLFFFYFYEFIFFTRYLFVYYYYYFNFISIYFCSFFILVFI